MKGEATQVVLGCITLRSGFDIDIVTSFKIDLIL